MKRLIFILLLFIPIFSYSQEKVSVDNGDVVISVNVSKINRTLGGVVKFFKDEVKQFKQELDDNITPEQRAGIDSLKTMIKYEAKYTHDAIHAGWVQGLQGKEYTPPYENKYLKK